MVIWISGLSGAGKSTLATALSAKLRYQGRTTITVAVTKSLTSWRAKTLAPGLFASGGAWPARVPAETRSARLVA
ncbi:adenylyl-sulfate kinase [Lamprobacter sp.]|uniref:adenylyl-sulfate kinase n=1 Tax=Lamprobacter sp. TaxID=3100796 RepID=UPI003A4DD23E